MEDVHGLPTAYLMAAVTTTAMQFMQKRMQSFTQIGQHVQTGMEPHSM